MSAGWYYAEGDPPGTQRYWDGELWQGDPRPVAPAAAPAGAPVGGGYHTAVYPEQSQATTILVLGILSIVICGLLGPVAWSMGNKELAAIDAGRRDPTKRGNAQAGRIIGIVATILLIVGVLFIVVALVALGASA